MVEGNPKRFVVVVVVPVMLGVLSFSPLVPPLNTLPPNREEVFSFVLVPKGDPEVEPKVDDPNPEPKAPNGDGVAWGGGFVVSVLVMVVVGRAGEKKAGTLPAEPNGDFCGGAAVVAVAVASVFVFEGVLEGAPSVDDDDFAPS
jgi:hypothetical protein